MFSLIQILIFVKLNSRDTDKEDIPKLMPVVLVSVYVILYLVFGLSTALIIGAVLGTGGAILVGFIRLSTGAIRDRDGRWHNHDNGQYISSNSAYYGYSTAVAAVILPFVAKADVFTNLLPQVTTQFTNLPTEIQIAYVVIAHGVGCFLSH